MRGKVERSKVVPVERTCKGSSERSALLSTTISEQELRFEECTDYERRQGGQEAEQEASASSQESGEEL